MRKILSTAVVALGPAISGSAALAQAPVFPPFNWTGAYAGVHAGVLHLQTSAVFCRFGCDPALDASDTTGIAGFQGGYNSQFGSLVVGLETDLGVTQAETSASVFGFTQSVRLRSLGTTRVRVGYASGDTLFFLTAGAAYGALSVEADHFGAGASARSWRLGFAVGGGAERALTNNWFLKADILYFDLGRLKTNCSGADCGKDFFSTRTKIDGWVARIGLNYRFGAPAGAAPARF